jgi:hypothetical protein
MRWAGREGGYNPESCCTSGLALRGDTKATVTHSDLSKVVGGIDLSCVWSELSVGKSTDRISKLEVVEVTAHH